MDEDAIARLRRDIDKIDEQILELLNRRGETVIQVGKEKKCRDLPAYVPGRENEILETARQIARLGLDGIKIHSLYIVRGTRMEDLYREGKYGCLDQEKYVELVCDVLELLPPEIVIQRLTGDPNPSELVAPLGTLQKSETLRLISQLMERRDSYQGKYFAPHSRCCSQNRLL